MNMYGHGECGCVYVCVRVVGYRWPRGNVSCRVGRTEPHTIYERYLNFSLCMSKCHEIVIYISYRIPGDDMRKLDSE